MSTLQRLLSDQKRILSRGWKRKLKSGFAGGSVINMARGTFRIVGQVPIKLRAAYLLSYLYSKKLELARRDKTEEDEVEFFALKQAAAFLWHKRYGEYCQKMRFDEKYLAAKGGQVIAKGYLAICYNWLIVVVYPSARSSGD